jgi:hypothetical protein
MVHEANRKQLDKITRKINHFQMGTPPSPPSNRKHRHSLKATGLSQQARSRFTT